MIQDISSQKTLLSRKPLSTKCSSIGMGFYHTNFHIYHYYSPNRSTPTLNIANSTHAYHKNNSNQLDSAQLVRHKTRQSQTFGCITLLTDTLMFSLIFHSVTFSFSLRTCAKKYFFSFVCRRGWSLVSDS